MQNAIEAQQGKLMTLFAHMFAFSGKKNTISSPLSVYSCLAMLAEGASGQSFNELSNVFGYQGNGQLFPANIQKALAAMHSNENKAVIIKMSNMLYASTQFPLKPGYTQAVVSKHWATAENVSFFDPTVKDRINDKISQSTNGLIKNCISQLSADTQAVLVNTIYFKGLWKKEFEKSNTRKEPFTRVAGDKVNVDFMNGKLKASIFETTVSKYLALAYKGDQVKFVIELPKSRELSQTDVGAVLTVAKNHEQEVRVFLPKFKFEFKCEQLLEVLKNLGVVGVTKGLGLEKISDAPIALSQVIHQAFVQVDEEGTEAAAATVAIMTRCAVIHQQPIEFRADSPFFFHIVDVANDVVLFSGAVQEPKF